MQKLLAKLINIKNPIYAFPNATKHPQTDAKENENVKNINQFIGVCATYSL